MLRALSVTYLRDFTLSPLLVTALGVWLLSTFGFLSKSQLSLYWCVRCHLGRSIGYRCGEGSFSISQPSIFMDLTDMR